MLEHAGQSYRPLLELGGTILARQALSAKLREHAILLVAQLSRAHYEWVQHVPIALAMGATQEQVDAIEREDIGADCFDDEERDVLAFTRQVVLEVCASDEIVEALRARLPDRELVELTLAIGFYMTMARLMVVTGVDVDAPAGDEVVRNLAALELPGD
jgi:alkylhydroperoxidase family enzyme